MWIQIAQLLFSMVNCLVTAHDTQYECGSHGRFEYCIDGNPTCVIGCHCYPGYYFDTETKICEPNIKLIRTSFDIGSRRVSSVLEQPELPLSPVVTTETHHKVDISNKDVDEIGDWLYNQFFKTIENQVINNNHSETPPVTRRKGGDSMFGSNEVPIDDLITRRSRKKASKKQKKQEDLRRKLLRISEDDSLFKETKESSSSDSDSSYSDDSDEDASTKLKPKPDRDHTNLPIQDDDNDNHDVKEIIAFNKAPKPALPPFVFLPGMQTPFFAPAFGPPPGLIPPFMSMFPGPPVFPPQMPFGQHMVGMPGGMPGMSGGMPGSMLKPPCNSSSPSPAPPPQPITDPEKSPPPPGTSQPPIVRSFQNAGRKKRLPFRKTGLVKNQKEYIGPDVADDAFSNVIPNPTDDLVMSQGQPSTDENKHHFKYLSELIHQSQENPSKVHIAHARTFKKQSGANSGHDNIERQHEHLVPSTLLSGRRSYYEKGDTYYAKLGREIASLIRNINPDGGDETGTPHNHNIMEQILDNNERYGSKSYWERAVRSPLNISEDWFLYNTQFKPSNDDLYEIENKAKYAATTLPPFNLEQLENIINIINKPHNDVAHIFRNHENDVINIVHDIVIENPDNQKLINIQLKDSLTPERFDGFLVHSANAVDTHPTLKPLDVQNINEYHFFDDPEIITDNNVYFEAQTTTEHLFFDEPVSITNMTMIQPVLVAEEIKRKSNGQAKIPTPENIHTKWNKSEIQPSVKEIKPRNDTENKIISVINDKPSFLLQSDTHNKTDELPSIWDHVKIHNAQTIKNYRTFHRHLSQKPKFLKAPRKPPARTPTKQTTRTTTHRYSNRQQLPFKYFQNSYFEHY